MSGCPDCWETPCSCLNDSDYDEEIGFIYAMTTTNNYNKQEEEKDKEE